MFEHHSNPLLPVGQFIVRLLRSLGLALALVAIALFIGMLGYHGFEGLSWLDSFLNASMILSGMGPVNAMKTDAGKFFSGCYALFSGLAFISITAVVLSPVVHRMLHKLHRTNEH